MRDLDTVRGHVPRDPSFTRAAVRASESQVVRLALAMARVAFSKLSDAVAHVLSHDRSLIADDCSSSWDNHGPRLWVGDVEVWTGGWVDATDADGRAGLSWHDVWAPGWTPQEREGGHGARDLDEPLSSGGAPLAPGAASAEVGP